MKKNLLLSFCVLAFSVTGFSQSSQNAKATSAEKTEIAPSSQPKTTATKQAKPDKKTKALRKKHASFLKNSPYKKTLQLSKTERKSYGIPPNKYYESEWELTVNPEIGRPTTENITLVRNQLLAARQKEMALGRTPGDAVDNSWVERGPTNVGGRTRGIMFDPNDATYETVFAGGVSGGLWKNTNISNANSTWTRVGIPENLSVSCITYDPNNTSVFYVGTGESYVGGDVNGDGVWKSTNGGLTFTKVFGGITGPTTFQSATNLTINSPTGLAGNYPCYPTNPANFGVSVTSPITANIVLVNDGTGATASLGCGPLSNGSAVSGKIALIRRGDCTFVEKVKNAQLAGAVGAIVMNNVDGQPIPMGGTDTTITIPSIMISKADGDLLEAALASGAINGTLNPSLPGAFTGNLVPGQQHINDIKVRNNGGVSEVYVAAGDTYYGDANAATYMGGPGFGLFKSVNGGQNWSELTLPSTTEGIYKYCPNDIAIGADNKIWVATTSSVVYGNGGGTIFSSTDGTNFTKKYTIANGDRTQIAVSSTAADKVYVLGELRQVGTVDGIEITIIKTTDGFTNATATSLPQTTINPAERTTTYGFTGAQAFFDLMIEVAPGNDETVYVGGIDLYKTLNGGTTWSQISTWNTGSAVHSDQHAMSFKPNNPNVAIFANDGGVYYAGNLATATADSGITSRNNGFNVTQFYSLGVAPTGSTGGNLTNDYFAAGAQDNGTQYFGGVTSGANQSVKSQSGDGAHTMFDQGADKYYISNYVYNNSINYRPITGNVKNINSESTSNGAFIAPMALDSSLDMLYTDYTSSTPVYQIRRYSNYKSPFGGVQKVLLTDALLTSSPTALTVSKYTTSSTTLLVGCRNGRLLRLTNANATPTWTNITGPGFVGSISDVEFGASESEIFVTFHNYNVVSIWYSSDAGVTWQNKEGNFPDIPVKCILQNPLNNNEVIIGTELGVWYTNTLNTASPVWKQSFNGMSNVKVTDLDLRNDNVVFAATYGRGIFSGAFTSATLGTVDFANSNGVKIYPNPSNGPFTISMNPNVGKVAIQVVDLTGKEVYSQANAEFNSEKSIDLSSLQSGVYVVKITGEGMNYSQKIVKE